MKHPVVWFEVMGENGESLRSFYGRLFDWKIDASNPMKYGMVEAPNGRGIPGGVGQLDGKPYPKVTFYVSTASIDALAGQGEGARGPGPDAENGLGRRAGPGDVRRPGRKRDRARGRAGRVRHPGVG